MAHQWGRSNASRVPPALHHLKALNLRSIALYRARLALGPLPAELLALHVSLALTTTRLGLWASRVASGAQLVLMPTILECGLA